LRDSVSDRCSRAYCRKCLATWYGDDLKKIRDHRSFLCHFCSKDCCCSRCQRRDNLTKLAGFYENLGGDIDALVDNSPISLLIDRIVEMSRPKILKTMKPKENVKKK
jgi:Zinc-finger domain of monoamine-oxidase A repressor R1